MRIFEIMLLLVLVARVFAGNRLPKWARFAGLGVLALHLLFEGYRWQMWGLYVFAALDAALYFRKTVTPRKFGWARMLGGAVTLLVFTAPPILFPIPKVAASTGPYPIGTAQLYLVDTERTDPFAPDPGTARELMVQVWFPTTDEAAQNDPVAPWMDGAEIVAPYIAEWIEMPAWFLDHLVYSNGRATRSTDVRPNTEGNPVIVFSHGYGGFRAQNTFQVQELASYGYVVISIEHTYAAAATLFPDGRVAPLNPATLPTDSTQKAYDDAADALGSQWANDIGFVLDEMAIRNTTADSMWSGTMDFERIGVMGHSMGGGATVQFCAQDTRCKAGLGLDAWLTPATDDVLADGPDQPFLYLYSETWPTVKNWGFYDQITAGHENVLGTYTILGTSHYDFTDLPALSTLAPQLGLKGPLNGQRVMQIINEMTLAFFGEVLLGEESAVLAGDLSEYPELNPIVR